MSSTTHRAPERELLAFAAQWARYGGGPPALIRDRFGMDETEFFTHILEVTEQSEPDHEVDGLRRVARQRLWLRRV
ncbi:DUF3263 domain-containing protein [Gordonia sp. SL306]|uniref:DUF3263 domain-containing protein n=1 Tax=Gordonia sp. SL306 TaxID=2995145 RepID=UPI003B63F8C1